MILEHNPFFFIVSFFRKIYGSCTKIVDNVSNILILQLVVLENKLTVLE